MFLVYGRRNIGCPQPRGNRSRLSYFALGIGCTCSGRPPKEILKSGNIHPYAWINVSLPGGLQSAGHGPSPLQKSRTILVLTMRRNSKRGGHSAICGRLIDNPAFTGQVCLSKFRSGFQARNLLQQGLVLQESRSRLPLLRCQLRRSTNQRPLRRQLRSMTNAPRRDEPLLRQRCAS